MDVHEISRYQPWKYRLAVMAIVLAGAAWSGCALRRSASFLPVDEVQRIRVSQNVDGRQMGDVRVVDDPAQIAQICEFLEKHEEGWEPIWDTPWAGEYSITLESNDSWQSVFVVENAIQTNTDGVPVKRKLSPESRRELLALLGLGPAVASGYDAKSLRDSLVR